MYLLKLRVETVDTCATLFVLRSRHSALLKRGKNCEEGSRKKVSRFLPAGYDQRFFATEIFPGVCARARERELSLVDFLCEN